MTRKATAPATFVGATEAERPMGYREWIYLGTPLTPNDMNGGAAGFPEFHNVYIDPAGHSHWKKTGDFADGTVLVKELVSVASKSAPSGNGYFMGDFVGLEMMVKSAERFPDAEGNWAFFSFGHAYPLAETAKPRSEGECAACHSASATQDMVFTRYYPVLEADRP